ncbi:MAG: Flp pilus assembly protein CpaB [Gammaproteobacteria bacterium]|nr:Flp pilus assembly protein CpaB [Gammaproteobacteria bacterium]
MFKKRGLLLITLSLMMGGGAAFMANRWVAAQVVGNEAVDGTLVVAAAMAIPYGTKVEARHLKYVEIPNEVAPTGFFTAMETVEGTVSTTSIARGEILIAERFAAHDSGSTLAALVSENMRALTVRVNDVIGVAGFLLPGNRVDVLSSRKGNNRRAVTETIVHNIKVLAVDQSATTEQNEPVIVRAVTLEMTPEQAEIVVKARTEGEIQLTLRNPLERQPVAEPKPKPVVARSVRRAPRNTTTTITVIRGTKVDTTKTKT